MAEMISRDLSQQPVAKKKMPDIWFGASPAQAVPMATPVAMPVAMPAQVAVPVQGQPYHSGSAEERFRGVGTVLAGSFVTDMGLEIQRGFRRKLLTILLMQIGISLLLGGVVRVFAEDALSVVFPAQSYQALALGIVCVISLPLLSVVRDKHPWNMVFVTLWSMLWGLFMAAAQLPGAFVRSNLLFIIFGACFVGLTVMLIASTSFTRTISDGYTSERQLWSFTLAGWSGWIVMVGFSIGFYAMTSHLPMYDSIGHFIGGVAIASLLFAWVAYDASKLCKRMQPDDYMKGVVYFYTDFLFMCCCCIVLSCLGGGGGGS